MKGMLAAANFSVETTIGGEGGRDGAAAVAAAIAAGAAIGAADAAGAGVGEDEGSAAGAGLATVLGAATLDADVSSLVK
jgi:hypothetical protein